MGLQNSKVLKDMIEDVEINDIALKFGVIGAGQKGNKDADIFAAYTYSDGSQIYPSLAVNFSKQDMIHLKNIPQQDRIHFDGFQGAARTPSLVVEAFDPQINKNSAIIYRNQLAEAMERKFSDVDHLFICAGAGGGFGTGFVSLVLGLIQENFFPVPITLLLSSPIDDETEISNALLLFSEINEFFKLQNEHFPPGHVKAIGGAIIYDNKKLFKDFTSLKEDRKKENTVVSWKDEGNDAIISTIHEANIIPANFGSDNISYDPSDFVKLMQVNGGFMSIHKASLEAPFDVESLNTKMKNSILRGYFSCDHNYDTARMYGGFVLRPSSANMFKDVSTEQTIKKNINDLSPTAQGKYGDPIWSEKYAVVYTIFSGMIMPNRIVELKHEFDEIKSKQILNEREIKVDISDVVESVKKSSFNPYASKGQNKFGSTFGALGGSGSVFSRANVENEDDSSEEAQSETGPKKKFGSTPPSTNVWQKLSNKKQ